MWLNLLDVFVSTNLENLNKQHIYVIVFDY